MNGEDGLDVFNGDWFRGSIEQYKYGPIIIIIVHIPIILSPLHLGVFHFFYSPNNNIQRRGLVTLLVH